MVISRLGRLASLIILVLLGGGCAQLQSLTKSDKPAPVVTDTSSKPTQKAPEKVVRLPARENPPTFQDLQGLGPGHLLALLGSPKLRRNDPPAQHWRYDSEGCSLHLFLYERSGQFQLTHGDARMPRAAGQKTAPLKTARDPCIAQIWRNGPNRKKVGES